MSVDPDSDTETIYIPLLEEGVPVVRPTQGRSLGDACFLVLATPDYNPKTETWEFAPGSVVGCTQEQHNGEEILVARKLIRSSSR